MYFGTASIARNPAKTIKGRNDRTSPIITPVGENKSDVIGSEMSPTSCNTVLIKPLRPSTGRSMKVRITSETMNGRMKSRMTRCCAT